MAISSHSMFVVDDLIMEILVEICLKSHAFDDHSLVATVFGRDSHSVVYLWNTAGQGPCVPLMDSIQIR